MPAMPFIGPGLGAVSAIGSLLNHGGVQGGPGADGTGALRAFVTHMLTGGSLPTTGPAGALTVDPSAALAGTNGLFAASRASALGQAKESAGNLTGSGYNNLFGSALAQSLAAQQKQLADTQLAAGQGNQQTWEHLFGQFGGMNQGQQYYQPSGVEGLAGAAGPLGKLAGMFGGRPSPTQDPFATGGTGNFNTAPQPYAGPT